MPKLKLKANIRSQAKKLGEKTLDRAKSMLKMADLRLLESETRKQLTNEKVLRQLLKVGLASKDDLLRLQDRVQTLERELEELRSSISAVRKSFVE